MVKNRRPYKLANFDFIIKLTFVLLFLHLTPVNAQDVYKVTTQRLNMRATPSAKGRLMGTLTQGTTVTVENIENGWALINYDGKICYVSAKFLQKVEKADNKENERVYQQEQKQESTQLVESVETVTVTEPSVTDTDEKETKKLLSANVMLFSGEGNFTDRLNMGIGWHFITLNGFGFDFAIRSNSARYGNRNFDYGPNYSYKLWANDKNKLYATAALCLSSRVQGMPDVTITSSGKTKEEVKYKYFFDFVANARVSYELPKVILSAGLVLWAPQFKFSDGYFSTGFHLSLAFRFGR